MYRICTDNDLIVKSRTNMNVEASGDKSMKNGLENIFNTLFNPNVLPSLPNYHHFPLKRHKWGFPEFNALVRGFLQGWKVQNQLIYAKRTQSDLVIGVELPQDNRLLLPYLSGLFWWHDVYYSPSADYGWSVHSDISLRAPKDLNDLGERIPGKLILYDEILNSFVDLYGSVDNGKPSKVSYVFRRGG